MYDLSVLGKKAILYVDTMQGFCSVCQRFHTLRPPICHPSFGYTWRFMRTVYRMLVQASARFLEEESDMSRSSILRINREY